MLIHILTFFSDSKCFYNDKKILRTIVQTCSVAFTSFGAARYAIINIAIILTDIADSDMIHDKRE